MRISFSYLITGPLRQYDGNEDHQGTGNLQVECTHVVDDDDSHMDRLVLVDVQITVLGKGDRELQK